MIRWVLLALLLWCGGARAETSSLTPDPGSCITSLGGCVVLGPIKQTGGAGLVVPAESIAYSSTGYTYFQQTLTFGAALNAYGIVSGIALNNTNNSTTQAVGITSVMNQGSGSNGNDTSAAQFTYVAGNYTSGDGGSLALFVVNNSTNSTNTSRGLQVGFYGPNPATNGIVFINEVGTGPIQPLGGEALNLIAVNQSFAPTFSVAMLTDNGSPSVPVNAQYAVWFDGSTYFTTEEYEGPSFRIGPTIASFNSKIEIDGSAAGAPAIKAIGYANTAAGGTAATIASLNLETLSTGSLELNGLVIASSAAVFNFASSTTGSGTQTFTNSPCGTLTTERWVPVTVTGQSGTWYVPVCH